MYLTKCAVVPLRAKDYLKTNDMNPSNIPSISALVKDNGVEFDYYRAGIMYYLIFYQETLYRFPVPVNDVGDASMRHADKAIYFMRWIRKAIDENTFETLRHDK